MKIVEISRHGGAWIVITKFRKDGLIIHSFLEFEAFSEKLNLTANLRVVFRKNESIQFDEELLLEGKLFWKHEKQQ